MGKSEDDDLSIWLSYLSQGQDNGKAKEHEKNSPEWISLIQSMDKVNHKRLDYAKPTPPILRDHGNKRVLRSFSFPQSAGEGRAESLTIQDWTSRSNKRIEHYKETFKSIKSIDLHGYTINKAYELFCNVVYGSFLENIRVVKVITGKGKPTPDNPTIRKEFMKWVKSPHIKRYIISIVKAPPGDGGDGAFYVLLRKKQP